MKFSEFNWRLIILTGIGTAILINVFIMILAFLLFASEILPDKQVYNLEYYFFLFAILSPLIASLISSLIVTFFSAQRRILNSVFSTLITFITAAAILLSATLFVSFYFYTPFNSRFDRCPYEYCKD